MELPKSVIDSCSVTPVCCELEKSRIGGVVPCV